METKKRPERKKMPERKPEWLRVKLQGGKKSQEVGSLISDLNLNTVCNAANCPNQMECYARGTATFMILGNNCTRNCRFCNVNPGTPDDVDPQEPENIGKAVAKLKLKHAVITSVTRDDLDDQGANQFKRVVEEIRKHSPKTSVELLIPDMQGDTDLIDIIIGSEPNVLNHNIETVPELYDTVRPEAIFERSVEVLRYVKQEKPHMATKSGIMLGLGETKEQVLEVFKALRDVDCDMITIGQYLRPSEDHLPIVEYVTPEQFKEYEDIAYDMGFKQVASGPLIRSSYYAEDISKLLK